MIDLFETTRRESTKCARTHYREEEFYKPDTLTAYGIAKHGIDL